MINISLTKSTKRMTKTIESIEKWVPFDKSIHFASTFAFSHLLQCCTVNSCHPFTLQIITYRFSIPKDIKQISRPFQLEEFSNQVANYFKSAGYKRGDAVALFMESRPEYVGIWLGLSKVGVVAALVNSNLRQGPLVHSITAAECKAIIYGSELTEGMCDFFILLTIRLPIINTLSVRCRNHLRVTLRHSWDSL